MKATIHRTMITALLAASVCAGTQIANATGVIGPVTGWSIQQRSDGRSILLFAIGGEPQAACSVTSVSYAQYAVDLATIGGRAIYASVMAAHLSGRTIGVAGTDTCDTDPTGEDVAHVDQYR